MIGSASASPSSTDGGRPSRSFASAWLGLFFAMILLLPGCKSLPSNGKASSAADKALRLETFDAAWTKVRDTHFDTNFSGLSWTAMREEFRPKAATAASDEELRAVLNTMLGKLKQSHMAVLPGNTLTGRTTTADSKKPSRKSTSGTQPTKADRKNRPAADKATPPAERADADEEDEESSADQSADLGLEFRVVGNEVVVFRAHPERPAALAGIRPGWVVRSINQRSFTNLQFKGETPAQSRHLRFLVWADASRRLPGAPGSHLRMQLLDQAGQRVDLNLERTPNPGSPSKLGTLPTMYSRLTQQRVETGGGRHIGVIHFNMWMLPVAMQFDKAIDGFRDAAGIVLDLRGNLGGIAGMITGLSGHFLDEPKLLGTFKTRDNELKISANPRRVSAAGKRVTPYAGPLAILIDPISISASELFASGLQDVGRARVFGETSAGQALPAIWEKLPNGDVLYHAFADFITPSGQRIEQRGVVPDEQVTLDRKDLLENRDAPLEAALKWIRTQTANRPTNTR